MSKKSIFGVIVLMVSFLVGTGCGACDRPGKTREALQAAGIEDIQLGGHSFLGCSDDDISSIHFTGRVGDRKVSGVVCCGLLKRCTVRY